MTQFEQEQAAKKFVEFWKNKGDEKSDTQSFWISLLHDVFGVDDPTKFIEFEKRVKIENKSFIDGYIPSTKVLIEQKSISKDLNKPELQSDKTELTPYGQAKRYSDNLDYNERARWIITCNFKEFQIYDMDKIHSEPIILKLEELPKQYYVLQFLIDSKDIEIQKEEEVSFKAGELVGKLYDEIVKLYINPENEETLKSLNMLCVRIVFCLYAEDAGLFGKHNMFHDYIEKFSGEDLREALIKLFKILDTPKNERDPYLKEELAQFPYVNGGLFEKEDIEIPRLNDTVKNILLNEASRDFDWSDISPTIFGAVFESTLNPETRRSGGMHYTSIENIHKVIDPLFLNELKYELDTIIAEPILKTRNKKLLEYQYKLANLKFLDPACGSGNFLTESYLSIRRLENKMIASYTQGQIQLGAEELNPIKVSIKQFYGIEINDFAVTVAKTALWIAEAQMYHETQEIINMKQDFLPRRPHGRKNRYRAKSHGCQRTWTDAAPAIPIHSFRILLPRALRPLTVYFVIGAALAGIVVGARRGHQRILAYQLVAGMAVQQLFQPAQQEGGQQRHGEIPRHFNGSGGEEAERRARHGLVHGKEIVEADDEHDRGILNVDDKVVADLRHDVAQSLRHDDARHRLDVRHADGLCALGLPAIH